MAVLRKISDLLNRLLETLAMFLVAVITLLTFSGIVTRFVFGKQIVWLYELTLVLFSWIVFLGISAAFKRSEHIRLDLLYNYLPDRIKAVLYRIVDGAVIVFLLFAVTDGIEVVQGTVTQNYNTISLSTAWFYAPFPLSAVVSLLHILTREAAERPDSEEGVS